MRVRSSVYFLIHLGSLLGSQTPSLAVLRPLLKNRQRLIHAEREWINGGWFDSPLPNSHGRIDRQGSTEPRTAIFFCRFFARGRTGLRLRTTTTVSANRAWTCKKSHSLCKCDRPSRIPFLSPLTKGKTFGSLLCGHQDRAPFRTILHTGCGAAQDRNAFLPLSLFSHKKGNGKRKRVKEFQQSTTKINAWPDALQKRRRASRCSRFCPHPSLL